MRLLIDTHLLIWAADEPERLPEQARQLISDAANDVAFSVVNLWEVMVKRALKRPDFQFDARLLRSESIKVGYSEVDVTSEHAFALDTLPMLHRDPFDRLLIAQAMIEGRQLLTADHAIAQYSGPIIRV